MRLNRLPGAASDAEPAGGRRAGAGVVRALSVTAAVAAVCAMGALPAMASTAHATKHSSKTTVSIPKTAFTHTNVKLSATVTGGKTPTGTVTFWLGTKKLCHGTLSKGKTNCEYKFASPAKKTITAKYSGNSTHKTSSGTGTITVSNKPSGGTGPIATTTTLTSPSDAAYSYVNAGDDFTLTATVAPTAGGSVPTGTVAFTAVEYPDPPVPANLECTATLKAADNGNAQCNISTAVGTWGFVLYEATFTPTAGSEWTGSNSLVAGVDHKLVTWDITSTLLTFNPATATANKAVTLTADVTDEPLDSLSATFSAKPDLVTFSIGGVAIPGCANVPVTDTSAPDDNGPDNIATCSYTPATSGTVAITATYSGDDYALGSFDTENLTVNP